MDFDGFDWDIGNRGKCKKHGVSVAEIEDLFERHVLIAPDPSHSATEVRFKAIGKTRLGRSVLLAFTVRRSGADILVRPISARYMHRKEVDYFEKAAAKPQN